jgi:hypothetical protein
MEKFPSVVETYADLYSYVAKAPRAPNQITDYLVNQKGMKRRTINAQIDRISNGGFLLLKQEEDQRILLDQDAVKDWLKKLGGILNFDVTAEPIRKKKPEDDIASITNSHSASFQMMNTRLNEANKKNRELEAKVSNLEKELQVAEEKLRNIAGDSILSCMKEKVLVPESVKSEPGRILEDDFFLEDPGAGLDPDQLLSRDGGVMTSMYEVPEDSKRDLTESNYIERICKAFRSGRMFQKRLRDEGGLKPKETADSRLDQNRLQSVNLLLSNQKLNNQTKLAIYAFWYFHEDPEMEELLRLAGKYDINADYVIRLLEKPAGYKNYQALRGFLLQAMSASEVKIKMEAARELLCGDWYVVADYCGKPCHFKLLPVEELQIFADLLKAGRPDEAAGVLDQVLSSTCGPVDHKSDVAEIESPEFLHAEEEDLDIHVNVDDQESLDDFGEFEAKEDADEEAE